MKFALANLIVLLIGVTGYFFVRERLVGDLYKRQRVELNQLAQIVRSTFFYNHAYSLAKNIARLDEDLKLSLTKNNMHPKLANKLQLLREDIGASIIYVINRGGKTIASTRFDEDKSLIGENYGFRPYFIEAMKGRPYVYAALGVTTNLRGIYYSAPVYSENNEIMGVFVIKMNAESFDFILNSSTDIYSLITEAGVVFSSSRKDWLFYNMPHFKDPKLKIDIHQFGNRAEDTISDLKYSDGDKIAKYKNKDYISDYVKINIYGEVWTLLGLSEYDSRMHFFVFSIYGLSCVIVFFLANALVYSFERLRESLRDAKQANEAKSIFLANTSHEVRTPIAGIIGLIGILEEEENLSENVLEKLRLINGLSNNLSQIINDILDYSKIEAGKLDIDYIDFNLKDVIDTQLTPFLFIAGKKNIQIELYYSEYLPALVNSDPHRIGQILTNVLSNAVKFTTVGKVELAVDSIDIDNVRYIEFICRDSGIGVSKNEIQKLFQSFSQADSSTSRRFGGTGLGLVITKELIRLLNGHYKFESEEGVGTTFTIRIPLIPPQGMVRIVEEQRIQFDPTKYNVLIAEDNPINMTVAKKLLEKMGFTHIEMANNGAEAYDKFLRADFDIIFMDCQMPVMSGYTATQKIREHEKGKKAIIIALTANAMVGEREKCVAFGMNDYVSKPINRNKLTALLNEFFS